LALIAARREVALEIEVERFVRLARFEPGRIACALKPGAPSDLPMRLARALSLWTDQVWRVEADAESQAETVAERAARQRAEEEAALRAHPFVAEALQAFPGAEITAVRAPADQGAEVVALRTPQKSKAKPAKESRS
jgi:DNA polymerase-3 subunit gamma/tau